MDYKIFVINGSANCGKDTFVKRVSEYLNSRKFTIFNYSTARTSKTIASAFFKWNEFEPCTNRDRQLLYNIKQLLINYGDIPFEETVTFIDSRLNVSSKRLIFFIHVREPEEIRKLKQYYKDKLKTILLRRPDKTTIPNNSADLNVGKYAYDFVFSATSVRGINENVKSFINQCV